MTRINILRLLDIVNIVADVYDQVSLRRVIDKEIKKKPFVVVLSICRAIKLRELSSCRAVEGSALEESNLLLRVAFSRCPDERSSADQLSRPKMADQLTNASRRHFGFILVLANSLRQPIRFKERVNDRCVDSFHVIERVASGEDASRLHVGGAYKPGRIILIRLFLLVVFILLGLSIS